MVKEIEAIVLDVGSGYVKAGLSGEDTPRSVFTNVIGTPRDRASDSGMMASKVKQRFAQPPKSHYVGPDAQSRAEFLELSYPVERGHIRDWDALERIWEHTFGPTELNLSPEAANLPILCMDTASTLDPGQTCSSSREKMAQILFETFRVPGFYVMSTSVLSLFASGRTRGLVVEVGHGSTNVVPVFEGYAVPHAVLRTSTLAGQDLNQLLRSQLASKGHMFKDSESHLVQEMKENFGRVNEKDMKNKSNDDDDHVYELPDGQVIQIPDADVVALGEQLFSPSSTQKGLQELIHDSIGMCDLDLQQDLYRSIVLAGGTTMLPGLARRIHQELSGLSQQQIQVIPDFSRRERGYNSQRKIAAWVGGSMFASLPMFSQVLVTKQEWEEGHETVIHRKCF